MSPEERRWTPAEYLDLRPSGFQSEESWREGGENTFKVAILNCHWAFIAWQANRKKNRKPRLSEKNCKCNNFKDSFNIGEGSESSVLMDGELQRGGWGVVWSSSQSRRMTELATARANTISTCSQSCKSGHFYCRQFSTPNQSKADYGHCQSISYCS